MSFIPSREHSVIQCSITQCPLPTLSSKLSWISSLPDSIGSFHCQKSPSSPVRFIGSFVWCKTDPWGAQTISTDVIMKSYLWPRIRILYIISIINLINSILFLIINYLLYHQSLEGKLNLYVLFLSKYLTPRKVSPDLTSMLLYMEDSAMGIK